MNLFSTMGAQVPQLQGNCYMPMFSVSNIISISSLQVACGQFAVFTTKVGLKGPCLARFAS